MVPAAGLMPGATLTMRFWELDGRAPWAIGEAGRPKFLKRSCLSPLIEDIAAVSMEIEVADVSWDVGEHHLEKHHSRYGCDRHSCKSTRRTASRI